MHTAVRNMVKAAQHLFYRLPAEGDRGPVFVFMGLFIVFVLFFFLFFSQENYLTSESGNIKTADASIKGTRAD